MTKKDAKVIGELADSDAVGLLGINMAESGDAIGVYGETKSEDGYGLYTPNDGHVGGTMESKAVSTEEAHITDTQTREIKIPSDEDTLQEALETAAAEINPEAIPGFSRPYEITIESGHSIQQGVRFKDANLGYIAIRSEDETVKVSGISESSVIYLQDNCWGPHLIDVKFDCQDNCGRGFSIISHSTIKLSGDSGTVNAQGRGMLVQHISQADIHNGIFSNNDGNGVEVSNGSIVNFEDGTANDNGGNGISVNQGSMANFHNGTANNNASGAVYARAGSYVNCGNLSANDNGSNFDSGIRCNGGWIDAEGATVIGTDGRGIQAERGGQINIFDGTVTGSENVDLGLFRTGTIVATECETTNSTDGDPHQDDMNELPNTMQGEGFILAVDVDMS